MRRSAVIWAGGGAAVLAGTCWVVKGGVILLMGEQPPLVFEGAFLLFPIAVVAVYAALPQPCGRVAAPGLVVAIGAAAAATLAGLGMHFGPDDWEPRENTATLLTPFVALAGIGSLQHWSWLGSPHDDPDLCPDHGRLCRWDSESLPFR